MQRYADLILSDIRDDTKNADDIPSSSDEVGIPDAAFLRAMNWAQQRLQGRVSRKHYMSFLGKKTVSIVADQAEYTIPDHVYLGTRIIRVRYSRTGLSTDYQRMAPINPHFYYGRGGPPIGYYRKTINDGDSCKIVLEPVPTEASGSLEFLYERALDKMDLRRAQVNGTPSGTDIIVDNLHADFATDILPSSGTRFICISDADGVVQLYNGEVSSYSGSTITLAANVSTYLEEGVALADLDNSFITIGKWTSTHSKLPEDAERYIMEYATRRILKRDQSEEAFEISKELKDIEEEIIDSYEILDKETHDFPTSIYEDELMSFYGGWYKTDYEY